MASKFNTIVLVAPLDWGLGHACRCIPLIHHLVNSGCKVLIAAENMQKELLVSEFPNVTFIDLMGYSIQYTKNKRFFSLKIFSQVPKILSAIKSEHNWLKGIVKKYNIDAIVSDNRYGLWHHRVPSVIITHQLQLKTPAIATAMMRWGIYRFLNRFSECWIPDVEHNINMAGSLSHPAALPAVPCSYLGGLSRFEHTGEVGNIYELLVVISGPEPQRSILENKLLSQLKSYSGKVMFVRGLPGNAGTIDSFNDVTIVNHLAARALNTAFEQSKLIISRSGYTTVMDILKLKKRSVLVPTPGQTEQEYLATHLKKQGWCYSVEQDDFSLPAVLNATKAFRYNLPPLDMEQYKPVLDRFLKTLSSQHT